MGENDTIKSIYKTTPFQQRRAQSVDETALKMLNKEMYGSGNLSTLAEVADGTCESVRESRASLSSLPPARTKCRTTKHSRWPSRSCFAPLPYCNFGARATLKKVSSDKHLIVIQDPSSQRLHWTSPPKNMLIIRKPGQSTMAEFRVLVANLLKRGLSVYIDSEDVAHLSSDNETKAKTLDKSCLVFDAERDAAHIDLLVCLGGDGTLLFASSVFQKSCPPILSFSLGSLGFLTPFDFRFHDKILDEVLSGNVAVLLRTRLSCVIKKETPLPESFSPISTHSSPKQNGVVSTPTDSDENYLALNEVVINRGPNPYLSNLDIYINGKFVTKVQGDGLIISTPTGSTAYAMGAGASMVHPNVPAMVICPICPHSLSFRPIVIPAGLELGVQVSEDSRLTAWLSIDGRSQFELRQQDSIKITTSVYPIPSICRFDQSEDWFESLATVLHWNLRQSQSSLDSDQAIRKDSDSSSSDDDNKRLNGESAQDVSEIAF